MKSVLTPDEVAKALGLSRRTMVSWLESGKLPGIKVGNRWRVKEEDLDKFIDEPNMYFNDYIHRARFVELQKRSQAKSRELVSCIYILACLAKPLDEFVAEGEVDVAGINRATRFWGPLERAMVRAALSLYDPRENATINETFGNLDDKSRQVMQQALRLRW
ncbi:MAG: helix-turn-helix domain-containing protein [Bacillota bacterium]